ncbi:hypothetical protein LPL18_011515 [Halomonas sp. CUBES01]|uniref:hypothetical protein n=1 Tax=Halomonas sp. CUBES01 TaxID=2897340 RepID=UPI001E3BACEE|nr:hypothetical protein [Halomonas sp. CUBES01]MEC4767952.1 hypothetical protein [Halomonas sp. CUBES01]
MAYIIAIIFLPSCRCRLVARGTESGSPEGCGIKNPRPWNGWGFLCYEQRTYWIKMNIEMLISWLNLIAAIFMGVEYLFNAPLHKKINDFLVNKMDEHREYTNSYLREVVPFLNGKGGALNFAILIVVMIFSVFGVFADALGLWPFNILINDWMRLLLGMISVVAIIILTNLIPEMFVTFVGFVYNLFSLVIRSCPKGVIAALGFVLLLISLFLQLTEAY